MIRLVMLAAFLSVPLGAGAECLTKDSIKAGVVFTRSDGRHGFAQSKGAGIFVDYDTAKVWQDERQTAFGVYEKSIVQYFQDDPDAVGGGTTEITRNFRGTLPEPAVGQGWQGKVGAKTWQNTSSDQGGYATDASYAVRFAFLPEIEGKISGCSYRAIPVEAQFSGGTESFAQRWLYFPDLGFGLETRRAGATLRITGLKPA